MLFSTPRNWLRPRIETPCLVSNPPLTACCRYEDDRDEGEWFLYTGSGGRDLSGNKRTSKVPAIPSAAPAVVEVNVTLAI